jgi:thermostable 8-oxoguanine DNA glycosylase
MNNFNVFKSKSQVIDLIRKADDDDKTKELINKFKHIKQERIPFYLTSVELDEILLWKLRGQFNRQSKIRRNNTAENIKIITQAAFAIKHHNNDFETKLRLRLLTMLSGVEVPVASAIMTLCFPTLYSVIDFRNWRQFYPGSKEKTSYTPNEYLNYLQLIRQLADSFEVTPQEIDMAIWQLDVEQSQKTKFDSKTDLTRQNKMIAFFSEYSDDQLKKLLAIEVTSKTDKSPTVKNIFEELKRRNPEIEVGAFTDTDDIIKYLSK